MTKLPKSQSIRINGPAGNLEGLLEAPQDVEVAGCAVVCHPHPLHGGTMQNKVAHTLARSFVGQGFATLRFNFRGVSQSDGEHDEGRGELEDAIAAVDWLQNDFPKLPLWVSGFSFGAAMAVRAAIRISPEGLVSIAPAVSRFAESLAAQPDCPWLILQGDQDELVDIDETIAWVNELKPGPELQILDGAEHFFHGKLTVLREAVGAFVEKHMNAH